MVWMVLDEGIEGILNASSEMQLRQNATRPYQMTVKPHIQSWTGGMLAASKSCSLPSGCWPVTILVSAFPAERLPRLFWDLPSVPSGIARFFE
jgi:hypothetical protein